MSDWRTSDLGTAYNDGTAHFKKGEVDSRLTVTNHHGTGTRAVSIYNPETRESVAFVTEFGSPMIRKRKEGAVTFSDDVPDPSSDLLSLIASHHKTKAWMPLLDKLAEEYPEHFEAAVAAHTAARQSNAAEHYARAFAATQRS